MNRIKDFEFKLKNDFGFILYILFIPVSYEVLLFLFGSGFAGLG